MKILFKRDFRCKLISKTALILVTASFSNKKNSAEQGHTALFAISNNLKIIVLRGNSLLCI